MDRFTEAFTFRWEHRDEVAEGHPGLLRLAEAHVDGARLPGTG
ncbi:hypothetical protein ACWEOE_41015 [Amycolatopsis sp. NPDC004368]